MLAGTMPRFAASLLAASVSCVVPLWPAPAAEPVIPADFTAFQRDVSPLVLARRPVPAKHWRQIEPAIHHLATQHADRLAALPQAERVATLAALAGFVDRVRAAHAPAAVLAPGRTVIGLLDPARGLDPKEITAIATAYGCRPTVYKRDADGETIATVADEFLAAVKEAAAGDPPATIIVLGHGLPTEIQSYAIRFERLAAARIDGAAQKHEATSGSPQVDLHDRVLVCDDCFSTDFLINLCTEIEAECRRRGLRLVSLPNCIAGTNRNCVGHADVGEKFVPHFWRDVIELYFIRRPRPHEITLRDFFENVDRMMYGYGRAAIVEGGSVTGYRLVDPEVIQDPVVIVPLSEAELVELRTILDLPADAPLPGWLDVG